MKIYICILFILTVLLFLIKNNKVYTYFSTFFCIFLLGQRWGGGVDFYGYLLYYMIDYETEKFYYIIQTYFHNNNLYFGLLIFFIYLFTTIISVWFFKKFCKSNISSFIFFISEYHIMSINPLRTYIAINFFLISLYFIIFYKKNLKGFIFIVLGGGFHQTIYSMLLVIYILKLKIKKKQEELIEKVINIILFVIPIVKFNKIIYYLLSYIPKYSNYINSPYDITLSTINIIRYYIILILFIYFLPFYKEGKKERYIKKCMILYLFLMGISVNFAPLHRIAYYLKIFEVIYFCFVYEKTKDKIKKILVISIFLVNYLGMMYKDMGWLKYYNFKNLRITNEKTDEEYKKELIEIKEKNDYQIRTRS